MRVRTGDTVVVISGKDKGKTGQVLRVLPTTNRIVVAGINMRTRHMKATPQQSGQKIQYEASLHRSNVMLVDPKTSKRTRISYSRDEKKGKQRIAKRSGEALSAKAAITKVKADDDKKTTKAAAKDTKKAASTKKETAAKKADTATTEAPTKKPFWKRMISSGADPDTAENDEGSHMSEDHSIPDNTPPAHRPTSRGS